MTSSRGRIGPDNVLATSCDSTADNNADTDNTPTTSHSPINFNPTELDELQSYELLYKKMMNLFKEILLMFFVCIVYTVLTHDFSPPKVTRSPPAFPFFRRESIVSDWYRGDVSSAVTIAEVTDIGFVMFYAPWDAESQEVRQEFEIAAQLMEGHVGFTAVNCWQPGSECRRKYRKVFKWPVLLAYTSDGKGIQYNGPKVAAHMVKFLNNVMYPYRRVNTSEEIKDMLVEHDAVIVATVDCRPSSKSFAAAYNVALKLLEKDPLREIAFAISAQPKQEKPSLKLHVWHKTLIYPTGSVFKSRALTQWVCNNMHQVTMWLAPTGSKSQQLSGYMQGPTLILFTPQNPLLNQMDYYIALKQIAQEYYTCNDTMPSTSTRRMYTHRQNLRKSFSDTLSRCKLFEKRQQEPTVSYAPSAFYHNNSRMPDCSDMQCDANDHLSNQCHRDHCYIQPNIKQNRCTDPADLHHTFLYSTNRNRFTTRNLLRLGDEWRCRMAQFAKEYHPVYFATHYNDNRSHNVEGLACKTNTSLTMLAMDSLLYHQFAESLGVDILRAKRKTALVIVNPKEEMHAVLEGYFSDNNLREFILNFTSNNIPRALVDSTKEFRHTHRYKSPVCKPRDVCVKDLDAKNFVSTILNPTKVVIVLYHSLQCAFCSGVSYIFLEAARVLANVSSIQFVRVDGDRNTLPWEYTMERYPSILLFPALHKSESRAYPDTMPITISNIISFILANLDSSIKLQAMWEICNYSTYEADRSHCVAIVRRENLAHIETTLREWRMAAPWYRQRILRKLQLLKNIHMNLAIESATLSQSQRVRNELDQLSRTSLHSMLIKFIGGQFKSWRDDL